MRFVGCCPTHPAAPVPVRRWFLRWYIVEGARRNEKALAIARLMRNRAIAPRANLSREALRFRKIVTRDQLLTRCPTKLIDNYRYVRCSHAARSFPAAGAIAVAESKKGRSYLIADRLAKATPSKRLIGHCSLLKIIPSPASSRRRAKLNGNTKRASRALKGVGLYRLLRFNI